MLFDHYEKGPFFDEMFSSQNGDVFRHYEALFARFQRMEETELRLKQKSVDDAFLEQGVTFTVYSDDRGTERIFPFDLLPRVIPEREWSHIEQGLMQRIVALNLFLNDVYQDRKIITDGVVPAEVVDSAVHYRPEMRGIRVPKDIYIHVCGTDLIRDEHGEYLVLEDNGRCPSGVSYVLENREAMKRAFPGLYQEMGVRPVDPYPELLLQTLRNVAPRPVSDPVCVLLTPGVHNSGSKADMKTAATAAAVSA